MNRRMDHIAAVSAWRQVADHAVGQFKESVKAVLENAATAGSTLSQDSITRCAQRMLDGPGSSAHDLTVRTLMRSCSVFPFRRNVECLHRLNDHLTVDNFHQHFSQHPEYSKFFCGGTSADGASTGTCDKHLTDNEPMRSARRWFMILHRP